MSIHCQHASTHAHLTSHLTAHLTAHLTPQHHVGLTCGGDSKGFTSLTGTPDVDRPDRQLEGPVCLQQDHTLTGGDSHDGPGNPQDKI